MLWVVVTLVFLLTLAVYRVIMVQQNIITQQESKIDELHENIRILQIYEEIASRPPVDALSLLDRMLREAEDNK